MGFSVVTGQLILFIAVMAVLAGAVAYFTSFASETQNSMQEQRGRISDRLRTAVKIGSVSFSDSGATDSLLVYVKNIGESTIDANCSNLYVDSVYIDLWDDSTNRITYPGNETGKRVWRPGETLRFNASGKKDLDANDNYEVLFVTCNGVSATDTLFT